MSTENMPDPDHYKKVIEEALQKIGSASAVAPPAPIEDELIGRRIRAEEVVHVVMAREGIPPSGVIELAHWKTRVASTVANMQVTLPMNERFDLNHALGYADRVTVKLIEEAARQRAQAHADWERANVLAVEREVEKKQLLADAAIAPYVRPLGALHGIKDGLHNVSRVSASSWTKLFLVLAHAGLGAITGNAQGESQVVTPPPRQIGSG